MITTTRESSHPDRPARRWLRTALASGWLAAQLVSAASSAAFTLPGIDFTPPPTLPPPRFVTTTTTLPNIDVHLPPGFDGCLRDSSRCFGIDQTPGQRALLVLMENGGFDTFLPDELGFDILTCGDFEFEVSPGDDIGDLIDELFDTIVTNLGCLDPNNWDRQHIDLREHVLDVTDTALEDLGFGIVTSGVGLANVVSTLTTAHPVYARVEILEDEDFTIGDIDAMLAELAPDFVVDVHVLSHGNSSSIGPDGQVTREDIEDLANIPGLHLGAVYQQNCFGSPLRSAWRTAGARVVNGSRHINYGYMAYPDFLSRWLTGQTFATAVSGSLTDVTPLIRVIHSFVDTHIENFTTGGFTKRNPAQFSITGGLSSTDEVRASAMRFRGNRDLRVTD